MKKNNSSNFKVVPKVNEVREFLEITGDFSNPLEIVREAISNSYDAGASEIRIHFEVVKKHGRDVLRIELKDNGSGIERDHIKNFFDLGNSTRVDDKSKIGEKGHGTKVYFNSDRIEMRTSNGKMSFCAIMEEPINKLHEGKLPEVVVNEIDLIDKGTEIIIDGYNDSRREKFNHENLKDYIMWFTKHGSIEKEFGSVEEVKLFLKGLGRDKVEKIEQGHYFPPSSKDINKLFEEHNVRAPDHFSKKMVREGSLRMHPEIRYQAVFSIEGKYVKHGYNDMIRRPGYVAPEGAYSIRERYGLWLCKDHIPIQRENEWITTKGNEFTRFHAFVNCQGLQLTANRGSVNNTPSAIIQDLKGVVRKIYEDITSQNDWQDLAWLEDEAVGYKTREKEKKLFDLRIKRIKRANVAKYKETTFVEPERESGVYSIVLLLSQIEKDLFPFCIVDYDTHEGIDVIAKGDNTTPLASAKVFYVEFKRNLSKDFNHSFENLHSIVCWDTDIKHDESVKDLGGEERKMKIQQMDSSRDGDYTHYYLDAASSAHKIEVFVLKDYLKEKLGMDFRPRASDATL